LLQQVFESFTSVLSSFDSSRLFACAQAQNNRSNHSDGYYSDNGPEPPGLEDTRSFLDGN